MQASVYGSEPVCTYCRRAPPFLYLLLLDTSEQPCDTLFPLSPRQIVTSIVAALSWLISLLLQNQAFSRQRRLGIHFAQKSLQAYECLMLFSPAALINEPNSKPTGSSWS